MIHHDFTPQAHARAGGYVIGAGVHINIYINIYIYIFHIGGRNSRRIYRLALLLLSPVMLPRQINPGFSYIIMRTLLYLYGWMTQLPTQMHR